MSNLHQQQKQLQAEAGTVETQTTTATATATTTFVLPLDVICGPIASYLDRCSFNNLGLCCRSIYQKLDSLPLSDIQWPDSTRLFLHSYARCFAFSSDGCYLVCGDMQGNITLWNRKKGKSNVVWRPNNNINTNDFSNDVINIHTISIGWINRIVVWKSKWIVCGNTESNTLHLYNFHTQQQKSIVLPQLIRKIIIPKDRYLYILTGHNRYTMLGDNMFICKDSDSEDLIIELCLGFPKCGGILDITPLDATTFICWTKESRRRRQTTNSNNSNDDNINNVEDIIHITRIICWDQKSGQSRTIPILSNTTEEYDYDDDINYDNDDDNGNENYLNHRHVVDRDIKILAISSNTGTSTTDGKVLLGIVYQAAGGYCIWLDLWWYDWWMEEDPEQQWTYYGHFPLHRHCDNVNLLKLVDHKTWLIADTTREQFLVWFNDDTNECIQSLQANPNRFDVAYCGNYVAWIAWGSTMWIRNITKLWDNNNQEDGNNENSNGRGGRSQLVVRGSGEFI